MATVHRITNNTGLSEYNFLTDALFPLMDTRRTTPNTEGTYTEYMELGAEGDDAAIMAAEQVLNEFAEKAALFAGDDRRVESIWWEEKASAETAKRARILSMELIQIPRMGLTPRLGKGVAVYELTVVREAFPEDRSNATEPGSSISALGGHFTISAIPGSRAARIGILQVSGRIGGGQIDRIWCGIRPTGPGVSNFNPLWQLENGNLGTDASTVTDADASPSGGSPNAVSVNFGTVTALINRVSIAVIHVSGTSEYDHFVGEYAVLARCKKSNAGDTIRVQMFSGYPSSQSFAPVMTPRKVPSDSFRFIELGVISIPPFPYRTLTQGTGAAQNFTIQVHAERIAGSGNLILDCLVLIPARHFVSSSGSALVAGTRTNHFTFEDGRHAAIFYNSSNEPAANLISYFRNLELPIEGGICVFAGERTSSQIVADFVDISIQYYPRHRGHREA